MLRENRCDILNHLECEHSVDESEHRVSGAQNFAVSQIFWLQVCVRHLIVAIIYLSLSLIQKQFLIVGVLIVNSAFGYIELHGRAAGIITLVWTSHGSTGIGIVRRICAPLNLVTGHISVSVPARLLPDRFLLRIPQLSMSLRKL